MTDKTPAELAAELRAHFDTKINEVKGIAEDALGKANAGEGLTTAQKDLADQAIAGMNEVKGRMDDFEQKMARGVDGDADAGLTAGQRFVDSDEFKALGGSLGAGSKLSIEVKTITSLTTDADGSAGALVPRDRVANPLMAPPERRMTIRDLIAPGTTDKSQIEYEQETGFTNNAGMVAEATLKPESALKYDLKTANVRKIAHWMRASSEILADAPALRSMIDERLRYGLALKEENQILNGTGVGQQLLGINAVAAAYAKPAGITVVGETKIDRLRLSMLAVVLAEYPATGFVLNPIDWTDIELTKDANGGYILANPAALTGPNLWGLPVVATQAQAQDRFTTGAWRMGAQIFDRQQAVVTVSTEDRDNFVNNLVTILAEERLALATWRPEAFRTGLFSAA